MSPVIHWFRRDLRLKDNQALQAAFASGVSVIPVFVFDPALLRSDWAGAPRVAFLLKALTALDESLRAYGSQLIIRRGNPRQVIPELVETAGASGLYFNRDYTPFARQRDRAVTEALSIPVHRLDDALMLPPGAVTKGDDTPYTVYTPFMKRWRQISKPPIMDSAHQPDRFYAGEHLSGGKIPTLAELGFETTIPVPEADERLAQERLAAFTNEAIYRYDTLRNSLNPGDTSNLSPYFRFGLLSPRQAYWTAREAYEKAADDAQQQAVSTWVNELIWREFYMHILYHFPHVRKGNFRREYDALEWRHAPDELQAWKDGQTGYPVVDAAMRQLHQTGWMANRARMIVASFLTKDLFIDWREGERHFMQWLIDGDPAANNGGWQWTAGTGTDAQPYFRIFNPVAQSRTFDPDGEFIRQWIPELGDVPDKYIHTPWEMESPPADYPPPIVDHAFARQRTLAAFQAIRET